MFVHAREVREAAVRLRTEQRLAIDDIAERLALSRFTVYHWVKHVPLERTRRQSAAQHRRSVANRDRYRRLREAAYALGVAQYPELVRDPTFRDFICMYIGEGSKRSRNALAIGNSDAQVMRLGERWLHRISPKPHHYSIQYHADQDLDEICDFWASRLAIDPGCIRLQRKSNSNQLQGRRWRSVNGVLTIRVNDTYARARMQAWMDLVRSEWG